MPPIWNLTLAPPLWAGTQPGRFSLGLNTSKNCHFPLLTFQRRCDVAERVLVSRAGFWNSNLYYTLYGFRTILSPLCTCLPSCAMCTECSALPFKVWSLIRITPVVVKNAHPCTHSRNAGVESQGMPDFYQLGVCGPLVSWL